MGTRPFARTPVSMESDLHKDEEFCRSQLRQVVRPNGWKETKFYFFFVYQSSEA